jgi:oxygen-dependent protoporphyrinogen oxidase
MSRFVIIGGGISGLAAAHRLVELSRADAAREPHEITLLEASARLGGTIHTEHRDGFLVERGPDSFISEKPEAVRLAERIGLKENLIETNEEHRRAFLVRDGRLRPVPEGFRLIAPTEWGSFLRSSAFSLPMKARIALDLALPRGKRRLTNEDDDESLADFIRRRFGRRALERIAQPMIGGIYTADPEKLSLRATMPRFLDMERDRRSVILSLRAANKRARQANPNAESRGTSGARYSLFLSFDGGMEMLTERLATRLPHGSVRLNTTVENLAFDASTKQWRITTNANETIVADAVCLALPAHRTAHLLRDVDPALAGELAGIPYASTATINLAFAREQVAHPLDGFGFVVPHVERRTLLACTFASVKFKGRAPDGYVLMRAFVGGALQPENFALDDDEMIARVRRDLAELVGATGAPLFTTLERWTNSMAQYHVGHLARLRRIRATLAAHTQLHITGNAFDGAGIPDCIRGAETVAEKIVKIE